MLKIIEFINLSKNKTQSQFASQHGGLRGHFALRDVQKLLEKLDLLFPAPPSKKKKKISQESKYDRLLVMGIPS